MQRMFLIVMGVSGSGKTTVGEALAARLGWAFLDADTFHPPANVTKMRRGEPLTDADRGPWLDAMRDAMQTHAQRGTDAVLTCSALKRVYRQRLARGVPEVRWVYLRISREAALARVSGRDDHFMPESLVDSQFEALEEPTEAEHVLTVDAERAVADVLQAIVREMDGTC